MQYQKRHIEQTIIDYMDAFPVISLTGPRQSGKSTLLQQLYPDYTYVTFDDVKLRNFIQEDPDGFIQVYNKAIIFDEAQKAPEIFELIKIVVDKNRQDKGRFAVTSSSQFALNQRISESLAGRTGMLTLLPYQCSEIKSNLRSESVFRGGYPELVNQQYKHFNKWFSSYIDTYINKDVRELSNIGSLRDFELVHHPFCKF